MTRIGTVVGLSPVDGNGVPCATYSGGSTGIGRLKNSPGKKTARFLLVAIGPVIQTVQLVPHAGDDVCPPNGSVVAILESEGIKQAVGSDDLIAPAVLDPGEHRVYGSDGVGNILGIIKFKNNGKIYIGNQNTGAALRTALDNLTSALSSLTSDLTTFATSCEAASDATVVAAATALAGLLPGISTQVNNVTTAIDALLDTSQ